MHFRVATARAQIAAQLPTRAPRAKKLTTSAPADAYQVATVGVNLPGPAPALDLTGLPAAELASVYQSRALTGGGLGALLKLIAGGALDKSRHAYHTLKNRTAEIAKAKAARDRYPSSHPLYARFNDQMAKLQAKSYFKNDAVRTQAAQALATKMQATRVAKVNASYVAQNAGDVAKLRSYLNKTLSGNWDVTVRKTPSGATIVQAQQTTGTDPVKFAWTFTSGAKKNYKLTAESRIAVPDMHLANGTSANGVRLTLELPFDGSLNYATQTFHPVNCSVFLITPHVHDDDDDLQKVEALRTVVRPSKSNIEWNMDLIVQGAWDDIDPNGRLRNSRHSTVRHKLQQIAAQGLEDLDPKYAEVAREILFDRDGASKTGAIIGAAIETGFVMWDVAAVVRGASPWALLEAPFVLSGLDEREDLENAKMFIPVGIKQHIPARLAEVRQMVERELTAQRSAIESRLPAGVRWADFVKQSQDEAETVFLVQLLEMN